MGGSSAADDAAEAQMFMLKQQIKEQKKAYQEAQGLYSPYQAGGNAGFQAYLDLLGISGADAQQQALGGLEQTPGYQAQLQAGQRALLQNASATGGLRGGNVQQGLAEFGSGLLGQYYQNQLAQLGALGQTGFNTATNLANIRSGNAAQIGQAYAQMGEAQANSILAGQAARQQGLSGAGSALGGLAGLAMGGPVGAAIGSGIGGGLGGLLGGK